ncbi:hypothetical protein TNCV_2132621, partial [Trichonephila clavipes]
MFLSVLDEINSSDADCSTEKRSVPCPDESRGARSDYVRQTKDGQSSKGFEFLLQNLSSDTSDALTDDSSDEEIAANNLLEFLLDSQDDGQETEHDS